MSITVPENMKASGGLGRPFLSAIPSQPSAATIEGIQTPVAPRLVPALVGPNGRTQKIYIECPGWCVVDHLDRQDCLDDVMHYSDSDIVQVSTVTDDDTAYCDILAGISADPTSSDPRLRAAHIIVNTDQREDAYLTPDMADELADGLIAFAAQLRHKAREVRTFNAAEAQA